MKLVLSVFPVDVVAAVVPISGTVSDVGWVAVLLTRDPKRENLMTDKIVCLEGVIFTRLFNCLVVYHMMSGVWRFTAQLESG